MVHDHAQDIISLDDLLGSAQGQSQTGLVPMMGVEPIRLARFKCAVSANSTTRANKVDNIVLRMLINLASLTGFEPA